jgi:hypothetical protein
VAVTDAPSERTASGTRHEPTGNARAMLGASRAVVGGRGWGETEVEIRSGYRIVMLEVWAFFEILAPVRVFLSTPPILKELIDTSLTR